MSKLRTKKTLAKRIKITGTGKILRSRIGSSHLKVKLDSSAGHKRGRKSEVDSGFRKIIRSMLSKV